MLLSLYIALSLCLVRLHFVFASFVIVLNNVTFEEAISRGVQGYLSKYVKGSDKVMCSIELLLAQQKVKMLTESHKPMVLVLWVNWSFILPLQSFIHTYRSIYKCLLKNPFENIIFFCHFTHWFTTYSPKGVQIQETHVNYFLGNCKFTVIYSWLFVPRGRYIGDI